MSNVTAVVVRKKTWERRLDAAKKKHRPKLQDWSRDRFQSARNHEFQSLKNLTCPPLQLQTDGGSQSALHNLINGSIDRIPCSELSVADFIELYEKPYKPCIITNIPSCEGWSVDSSWSPRELKNRFGDSYFKVGEDDDGYKVKVRFKYFYQYMKHNRDDSPLYLFDGNFDQDITSKSLLGDYKVPSYFTDDLLGLVGEERRPPYRWFVVGPERSGSEVHVDPLGTSAWNTVVVGRKRWVLFPPGTPKRIAKGLDVLAKGEDDEAINYFVDLLPRIKRIHRHVVSPIEFIQEAGETVFVPGGWWHGVLNVESSVAVTQNFCSYTNFDNVWRATRKGRRKLSCKWLLRLEKHHPVLAHRALELNRTDGFSMDQEYLRKKRSKEHLLDREGSACDNKDRTCSWSAETKEASATDSTG